MSKDTSSLFHHDGYLHLPSFISDRERLSLIHRMKEITDTKCPQEQTQLFLAGYDRQSADDYFLASDNAISFFFDKNKGRSSGNPFSMLNKVGHGLHNLCPVFRRFSHQEKFYSLLKELGHRKPLAIQSMFIFKQSKFGDEVPAHQDATFLYTEPNSVIGIWFALEDADQENGCLWVLPKGHKAGLKNRFLKQGSKVSFQEEQKISWPKEAFIPVPVKAGDAIVLHGLLPHFSEQNLSEKTRYAYTIHFIDRSCYFPKTNWIRHELAQ